MGPRIFIRGYLSTNTSPQISVALQWGRGFSSADTDGAARVQAVDPPLQWGRGFSSADTFPGRRALPRWSSFNGAADFHPRILVARTPNAVPSPASMGPRIFIRGYRVRSAGRSAPPGFNGAADFHPRIRTRVVIQVAGRLASMGPRIFIRGYCWSPSIISRARQALQWGSGFSSADTWSTCSRRSCGKGFNGAADFHPRILSTSPPVRRPPQLQWGRGFSSADTE